MNEQMRLTVVETPRWRLDDETRALGRRNIAEVRSVLARVRREQADEQPQAA